jgi:imidazolonepropionase-like amidohydrolase
VLICLCHPTSDRDLNAVIDDGARTVQEMKFPGAPYGLKMACGENPKRVYGNRKQFPSTEMGNVAGYRQAWADAQDYDARWKAWEKERKGAPPKRDLRLETLAAVLAGRVRVQMHCYRCDEMATMLAVAREFHYHIAAFHHAAEAYKVPDLLKAEGHLRRDVGRLVGIQDGGLGRDPGEHPDGRRRRSVRDDPPIRTASSGSTRRSPRPGRRVGAPDSTSARRMPSDG